MMFLADSEKSQIAAQIAQIEAKTAGEIVVVVASASDRYQNWVWYIATSIGLLLPLSLLFTRLATDPYLLFSLQLVLVILCGLLLQWRPLLMRLVPRRLKVQRADALATEQFLRHKLHHTSHRSGILIFVTVAEQYVRIIADTGIATRFDQKVWDDMIAQFITSARRQEFSQALRTVIEGCGDVLIKNFPLTAADKKNELADRLIVLPPP